MSRIKNDPRFEIMHNVAHVLPILSYWYPYQIVSNDVWCLSLQIDTITTTEEYRLSCLSTMFLDYLSWNSFAIAVPRVGELLSPSLGHSCPPILRVSDPIFDFTSCVSESSLTINITVDPKVINLDHLVKFWPPNCQTLVIYVPNVWEQKFPQNWGQ